jgi:hypothetical protein
VLMFHILELEIFALSFELEIFALSFISLEWPKEDSGVEMHYQFHCSHFVMIL